MRDIEREKKSMSVFGGDSWAREAQHRKRRVDDLLIEGINASAYKKLPNGKFSCLVCPQRPVLDTPLMLSTHMKGSRHRASESILRERELTIQNEKNKRIAISNGAASVSSAIACGPSFASANKTLILSGKPPQGSTIQKIQDVKSYNNARRPSIRDKGISTEFEQVSSDIVIEQFAFRDRRERELKFTAAGWKRDCHGKWFKDENVEFDSDEEDPNVCLGP